MEKDASHLRSFNPREASHATRYNDGSSNVSLGRGPVEVAHALDDGLTRVERKVPSYLAHTHQILLSVVTSYKREAGPLACLLPSGTTLAHLLDLRENLAGSNQFRNRVETHIAAPPSSLDWRCFGFDRASGVYETSTLPDQAVLTAACRTWILTALGQLRLPGFSVSRAARRETNDENGGSRANDGRSYGPVTTSRFDIRRKAPARGAVLRPKLCCRSAVHSHSFAGSSVLGAHRQ